MSRIHVDRSKCLGIGNCEVTAPHLFEVDDDGVLQLLRPDVVEPADRDVARRAVDGCPTHALSLVDESDAREAVLEAREGASP